MNKQNASVDFLFSGDFTFDRPLKNNGSLVVPLNFLKTVIFDSSMA